MAIKDARNLYEAGNEFRDLLIFITDVRQLISSHAYVAYCLTGEAKRGTDECEFNLILSTRSFLHLSWVMEEYERLRGHSLEKAIKSEFSGMTVAAMQAICNY